VKPEAKTKAVSDCLELKGFVLPALKLRWRALNVNIFVMAESYRFQFILVHYYFIFGRKRKMGQ